MRAIPPDTREELDKLERKHAENPEGRYFVPLANALRKAGEFYRAKTLLRDGLGRYPDYVSAHIVLGRCLQDEGSRGEAEFRFRHVLTLDPQNLVALRTLGELAASAGRSDEARGWYSELLVVDPMNEEARLALDELPPEPEAEQVAYGSPAESPEGEGSADAPGVSGASDEGQEPTADVTAGIAGATPGKGNGAGAEPVSAEVSAETEAPEDALAEPPSAEAAEDGSSAHISVEPEPTEGPGEGESPVGGGGASVGEDSEPADSELESEPVSGADGGVEAEAAAEGATSADESAPDEERVPARRDDTVSAWYIDEMHLFGAAGTMLDLDRPAPTAPEELYGREDALATETLAELYTRQGFFDRAARVYRELIRRRGSDPRLQEKLARLDRLSAGEEDPFAESFSGGFPADGERDTAAGVDAFAVSDKQVPVEAPAQPEGPVSIRDYLRGVLAWVPGSAIAGPPTESVEAEGATVPEETEPETVYGPADAAMEPTELAEPAAVWQASEEASPAETAAADESEGAELGWVEPSIEAIDEVPEEVRFAEEEWASDEGSLPPLTGELETGGIEVSGDSAPPPPDDDLFPWELPPSSSSTKSSSSDQADSRPSAGSSDSDTGRPPDDHADDHPAGPTPPEPESSSAPEPLAHSHSDERPVAPEEPTLSTEASGEQEDDDLESFQAWLRSLRR